MLRQAAAGQRISGRHPPQIALMLWRRWTRMPRVKKNKILDYSGAEANEPFGRVYSSVLKSEQYRNLSIGARQLYCCCRAQESSRKGRQCLFRHGVEDGNDSYVEYRDFVFPARHLSEYGIDRSNAVKWFGELEDAGFITIREKNKHRRKVNVYSFSDKWQGS